MAFSRRVFYGIDFTGSKRNESNLSELCTKIRLLSKGINWPVIELE
jgi:hypothetical protein